MSRQPVRRCNLYAYVAIKRGCDPNVLRVQVGNVSEENRYWGYPEAYTKARPSYYIRTTVGTSDLTASMSAAFASASLALQNVNKPYAQVRLLTGVSGLMCGQQNRYQF